MKNLQLHKLAPAVLVAGALLASPSAVADTYPTKPVTIIVPFAAGGTADVIGRIYADRLSKKFGQQFIIENRVGAGGNIGVNGTAKAAPDGYTIGVASVTIAINPHVYKGKMPFDPVKDLKPLMLMATQPNVLVVHPSLPAKTVPELISYLKENPGKETFASSGVGTSLHLCMELFMSQTGTKMAHVAYRSSGQVIQDVMAGHVKIACDNAASAVPQSLAGSVRPLAVSSLKRLDDLPGVPTISETIPQFEALTWFGLVAPAGLPNELAGKLTSEMYTISQDPEVQSQLRKLSAVPSSLKADEFGRFIKSELEKWGPVVEKAGIKAE
jgi:tripartite-type tricarboxylate transporter receptor subunit TctC